jgi:hypothetical protein
MNHSLLTLAFVSAATFFTSSALHGYNPAAVKAPTLKEAKDLGKLQVENLDLAISSTEATLTALKSLRLQVAQYNAAQDLYLQHTDDRDLLLQMTQKAASLLKSINDGDLTHTFDKEFIDELTMLAAIHRKLGI